MGLQPLLDLLDSFGGWPMTVDDWSDRSFDWRNVSAILLRRFGLATLVDVYNDIDLWNDLERSIVYVSATDIELDIQPSITLAEMKI